MSTLEVAALVVAGALLAWQTAILAMAIAMMANPKYSNVRYGVGPGLVALVIVLLVVLL